MLKYSHIHIGWIFFTKSIAARMLAGAIMVLTIGTQASASELELVMVEEQGCVWCARWMEEVGPEYPLTPEGLTAPLRRIDIRQAVPDDLSFATRAVYTPTFILVSDGQEIGRIEGYPGEDFFWGLLGRLIEQADVE
ncbi:hypothetical protein ACTYEO_02640 [Rhodophyticola sp. SM2404]